MASTFIIPEGEFTKHIYGLIKDQKYIDAVDILTAQLANFPKSRACLSLLGYVYYHLQAFPEAVQTYEELVKLCPDVVEYKVYLAQSYYKATNYIEATKAALRIDDPQYQQRLLMLRVAITFEQEQLEDCESLVSQCLQDDPTTMVNKAALLYKRDKFNEAKNAFIEAKNALSYSPDLTYNIALCNYRLLEYKEALEHISEIVDDGLRRHPELSIGSNTEGIEVHSVGNSQVLKETALVEAFNLKAAIEYRMKNIPNAKEALSDMPPRNEDELDPVTLHNTGLINMDEDPQGGFRKLNFLLANPPFPPETFSNLLLLYCQYEQYDLAADVLAEQAHLTLKLLTPELYSFIDATIIIQTTPEESYRKYEELTKQHIEQLRKCTKSIQDARRSHDTEAIKSALQEYDSELDKYMPILMHQAKIYWDRENYAMVEKIFRQNAEFCSERDEWKLNVAHVFYMQRNKFKQAIHYYEPIVASHKDNLLDITAIVLANLCVSYIMTSQNEEAENLMRKIEKEEEDLATTHPEKPSYHLCIVNLVIGTLYCSKGNFEFGISRIFTSFRDFDKQLCIDTWYHTKRCFLALFENIAKHIVILTDSIFADSIAFLDKIEEFGKNMNASEPPVNIQGVVDNLKRNTIADEAKLLHAFLLKTRFH